MKDIDLKEATPEQREKISKILSKARYSLLWISVKFFIGLFAANLISIFLGKYILGDVDPGMQGAFNFLCVLVNAIFMMRYFDGQMKASSDTVVKQIKEVLKKSE